MERKNQFSLHIVILSLALILVDLSTTVECLKRASRKRNMVRQINQDDSFIPHIEAKSDREEANSTLSCALSLAERHVEVCDLAWKIDQLHEILPHLHNLITNRLGKRKFSFTVYINKPTSTVDLLDTATQAILRSIGKFVQFLGYVQKLFDATVGGNRPLRELAGRRSLNRNVDESDHFSNELRDIHTIDEDEVHSLITKAWSRKCVLELLKSNKNICTIVSRINALDALLHNAKGNFGPKGSEMLPIKMYSENLSLADFLDAIHDGLLLAMTNVPDIPGIIEREPIVLADGGNNANRRKLTNEQGQEIKEIFQTSDFKVELLEERRDASSDHKKDIHNANRRMQKKLTEDGEELTDEGKEERLLPAESDNEEYWNTLDNSSEEVQRSKNPKPVRPQFKRNIPKKMRMYSSV